MRLLYRFFIDSKYSFEEAWDILEEANIEILYGSEEGDKIEFVVNILNPDLLSCLDCILVSEPYSLPAIDWEEQWAIHGHDFHEGCVNIDLRSFGREAPLLRLKPGAGFGDLSHPTTRLMIQLMAEYFHQQEVVDIGCGSGVLALSAAAMGAAHVYGVDIDPEAVEHARQNALLNQLNSQFEFILPSDFVRESSQKEIAILMNMIWKEQDSAWKALKALHQQPAMIFISGVLAQERLPYLEAIQGRGWVLQEEKEEEGWLAFLFRNR